MAAWPACSHSNYRKGRCVAGAGELPLCAVCMQRRVHTGTHAYRHTRTQAHTHTGTSASRVGARCLVAREDTEAKRVAYEYAR